MVLKERSVERVRWHEGSGFSIDLKRGGYWRNTDRNLMPCLSLLWDEHWLLVLIYFLIRHVTEHGLLNHVVVTPHFWVLQLISLHIGLGKVLGYIDVDLAVFIHRHALSEGS